ncbi:MAG: DegT/DnrJ/EryC1/StrS family aminotransferase [Bacteroidales bacterium]|nr:DegT/DnrJ/EryC1/StrS family aminotransferase [Bacteroidales bacterium]
MKKIPFNIFNSFYLNNKDKIKTISEKILSSGKYIRDENTEILEKNLSVICQRKHAVTTASCTDALFFAMKAAGIQRGDEVIIPTFSYIASLTPILMCDAIPVFADIDVNSLMLDISKVKNLINKKTKAIVFVQLFGSCRNLDQLKSLAKENDLILIEDAAQALGSTNNGKPSASFGDLSCISFDPTKIVSAFGTGGAVLTDNETYYQTLLKLIHHGKNNTTNDFEILGYNSKIPEFNAALINLQLDILENTVKQITQKANRYYENLKDINKVKCFFPEKNSTSTYHKFVIIAEDRDELRKSLSLKGIETRIHYDHLLHEQKLLKDFQFIKHDLSVAKSIKSKVMSLPIYPELGINEIDYICDCIICFYK